jgi:ABC-type branched-subunit amino acid transport system substrate-binding protein
MIRKSLFFFAFLLLASCSKTGNFTLQNFTNEKTFRIPQLTTLPSKDGVYINVAVFLPLSGDYKEIGESIRDSMSLAKYELKADHINLHFWDVGSDKDNAKNKISDYDFSSIDIILGPVFKEQAEVIYPLAQKNNLLMLTYSNDVRLLNKKGLYLFSILAEQQAEHITAYAAKNNYYNMYTILPNNKFGKNISNILIDRKSVDKFNVKKISFYERNSIEPIKKLKLTDAIFNVKKVMNDDVANELAGFGKSALLLPEENYNLLKVLKQLQYLYSNNDVAYKILGIGDWSEYEISKNLLTHNAWVADIPHQSLHEFNDRFEDTFKKSALRIGAVAYDSVLLLQAISRNTDNVLMISYQDITSPDGYQGITGVFRLKEDGSNQRVLSVYEFTSGNRLRVISKAKEYFEK